MKVNKNRPKKIWFSKTKYYYDGTYYSNYIPHRKIGPTQISVGSKNPTNDYFIWTLKNLNNRIIHRKDGPAYITECIEEYWFYGIPYKEEPYWNK